MSQFFDEYEEDEDQPTQPQTHEIHHDSDNESETQLTKEEQRLKMLHDDVENAQKNMTNKNVEKVVRTLQKNTKKIDSENFAFLKKFSFLVCNSKKISASTKEKLNTAIFKPSEKTKEKVGEKIESTKKETIQDEIGKILCISDNKKRIGKLNELNSKKIDVNDKFKIVCAKLLSCENELDSLIELEKLFFLVDKDIQANFKTQIEIILNQFKTEELFLQALKILEKFDGEIFEFKRLEFYYYVKNEVVETNNKYFRLLFLVKSEKYDEASDFYKENDWLLKCEKIPVLDALLVLGEFFLENSPVDSFLIFQHCFYSGKKCAEILNFLCCVLNEQVKNEKYFVSFLNGFVLLEENPLLLRSFNQKINFYKAFLLLVEGDKIGFLNTVKEIDYEFPLSVYKLV